MAVIAGQHVVSPLGGIVNARLTTALQGFAVDYWPPHDAIVGAAPLGARVGQLPVSTTPRVVAGSIAHTFSDDFYHRIHVRPRTLALGNVVSTQVETIEVWNAYFHPVTLVGIDGLEDGLSLIGINTFPHGFGALELITWDASVSADGPSSIDVILTWDFSAVPDGSLTITGTRVVAWGFLPNWQTPVRERLSWLTDVMPSPAGAEQRRQLRLSPRRQFEAELLVDDRERSLCDTMLHGWGSRVWLLPVWHDIQLIASPVALGATSISCTTSHRDFAVGGLALLRSPARADLSEAVEILDLNAGALTLLRPTQAAWPAGTYLYPARTAQFLEQPRIDRHTDRAWTLRVQFQLAEASDWPPALPGTLYRGFPVFDDRPDESDELDATYERLVARLDNETGLLHSLDTADAAFARRAHAWMLVDSAEHAAHRALLYGLKGRQTAVWVPTHADDLRLTATVAAASTSMFVEHVGYTRFALGQVGRRDLRIELTNGTVFHRRITGASEIDADTEQLAIDTALGQTVVVTDVARISFLALMRLAADEVDIKHLTDIEGVARCRVSWRALRDELG